MLFTTDDLRTWIPSVEVKNYLLHPQPVLGLIRRAVERGNSGFRSHDYFFGLTDLNSFGCVVLIVFHLLTPSLVMHRLDQPGAETQPYDKES
jgi:hypothetical protein